MNLTPRQLRTMEAIEDLSWRNGFPPTYDEIAARIGTSKVTALGHVRELVRKGAATQDRYAARSVRLVKPVPRSPMKFRMLGTIGDGCLEWKD